MNRELGRVDPSSRVVSRRSVLKAGLGVGAALVGSRLPAQPRLGSATPRIAVIGAGIGGLVAALTLQDAGVPCAVFESSTRIGGRMHSNRGFWAGGQTSEWCGEFIDTIDVTMRTLAARFGLRLVDVNAAEPAHSQDTNYFLGGYYTDAELAADLRSLAPTLIAQNRAIGRQVTYDDYTDEGYYFDHMSAHAWIDNYVPDGHDSRLGQYLDEATATENGLDTAQQSALNLILPIDSDERFHIENGNEQLPTAIAASLPSGTVRTGWRLTAIAAESDSGGPVTLTFSTAAGLRSDVFDCVILALPFSVLRELDFSAAGFDPLKRQAIMQLGYGTNSKLALQFDARYWNGSGAWPGIGNGFIDTDLAFQSTWDSSRAEPGVQGLLTNYTGGTPGAAFQPPGPYTTSRSSAQTAGYAQAFLDQLDVVWPGIAGHFTGLATLSYPTGDPNLRGSYSTYLVGQYTRFGNYEKVPQGRVFFAGEHTAYDFQGFMEGGALSGQRAAREVLSGLA